MALIDSNRLSYRSYARVILATAFVLLLIQTIDYVNFTVDDVFISLRVAENAAAGHGMVYNVGDYVEGFSDPLWVFMLTGAAKIGVNLTLSPLALMWFAKGLSFLFGLLTMAVLYRLTKKICANSPYKYILASLSVLFASMTASFVAWCSGGLEMTLVAFLYLCATSAAFSIFTRLAKKEKISHRTYFAFSLSFIFASLARPEPLMFSATGFAVVILCLTREERGKFIVFSVIPFVVCIGLFLLWRWNTYHDLLPNSFYSKTGGGLWGYANGIKYFFGAIGTVSAPLLVIIPFAYSRGWKKNRFLIFVTAMIATASIFVIYSGGDWMPAARFVIPIAPLLYLLAIIGSANIFQIFRESTIGHFIPGPRFILVIICIAFSWSFAGRVTIRGETKTMQTGFSNSTGHTLIFHQLTAEWLHRNAKDSGTFAAGEAGLIGYMNPQLRILDLNGLMDRHIASMRKAGKPFDAEYVLDRKPDYILIYGMEGAEAQLKNNQPSTDYNTGLTQSIRFLATYHLAIRIGDFDIYVRNN